MAITLIATSLSSRKAILIPMGRAAGNTRMRMNSPTPPKSSKRFANRTVTNGQIALFGLTGGLMPCPAAFTIVLVCLQLKRFALGIFMVLSFSAGLAFTLVATGALVAWSLRHAEKRFSGLGSVARKLPYFSSGILTLMGVFIGIQGWLHLAPRP